MGNPINTTGPLYAALGGTRSTYVAQMAFLNDTSGAVVPPVITDNKDLHDSLIKVKADTNLSGVYRAVLASRVASINSYIEKYPITQPKK